MSDDLGERLGRAAYDAACTAQGDAPGDWAHLSAEQRAYYCAIGEAAGRVAIESLLRMWQENQITMDYDRTLVGWYEQQIAWYRRPWWRRLWGRPSASRPRPPWLAQREGTP